MIRYTIIGGSNWYSLNDIRTFLVKAKAISENKALHSRLIKLMAKRIHSRTSLSDTDLWIGLKPSDIFISKYTVSLIYEVCSDKERHAITSACLLTAIDFSNSMKRNYPEIHKLMKKVKLVDVKVGEELDEIVETVR